MCCYGEGFGLGSCQAKSRKTRESKDVERVDVVRGIADTDYLPPVLLCHGFPEFKQGAQQRTTGYLGMDDHDT